MRLHELLRHVTDELPNSFSEDFKAQVRTMDETEFTALYSALSQVDDTLKYERHVAANPKTYGAVAHEVNRGAM